MTIPSTRPPDTLRRYIMSLAVCFLTALLVMPLRDRLDAANIAMLFLLAVLLVARYLGSGPAVLSAFVCVGLFDFFFVLPYLSLTVEDAQYFVTFAVMLVTALTTGALTSGLRREADTACARERRSRALYGMARDLAGAVCVEQVVEITRRFLGEAISTDATLLLPDAEEKLHPFPAEGSPHAEIHLAYMALQNEHPVECTQISGSGYALSYFPLRAPTRTRGVLAIAPFQGDLEDIREQHALIETAASLVAIGLERLHYVEAAQRAELSASAEHLRASLLSALSHDLRTPLTALRGTAETLALSLGDSPHELAEALRDQAARLSHMVGNLLDMARFQAGKIALRKEWQALNEVIGSSLKLLEGVLCGREVVIDLPGNLPLIEFDAILIERVFCNLIENSAKYSAAGTPIEISARQAEHMVEIKVRDHGKGFVAGREQEVFAVFGRDVAEPSQPGFGLGLAICRAAVEAHGGWITASNHTQGGAVITFALPMGTPPEVVEENDENAAATP